MAKLKAPLLSLGAAGAIGKAIVFFPWKGLDVVREYVVPANPNTTPQQIVRAYFRNAITAIHDAQAAAANPLDQTDQTAYAAAASLEKTPMTWFNWPVGLWVHLRKIGKIPAIFRGGTTGPGDTTLGVSIYSDRIVGGSLIDAKFKYGTSKSNLINTKDATITVGSNTASATITGLTNGVKYFWQLEAETVLYLGAKSGIYYGTPAA